MAGKWVQKAHIQKGGLHRSLGIPEGQKIPTARIEAAASRPGKVGKQARLAETFAKMRGHADGGSIETNGEDNSRNQRGGYAMKKGGKVNDHDADDMKGYRRGGRAGFSGRHSPSFVARQEADKSTPAFNPTPAAAPQAGPPSPGPNGQGMGAVGQNMGALPVRKLPQPDAYAAGGLVGMKRGFAKGGAVKGGSMQSALKGSSTHIGTNPSPRVIGPSPPAPGSAGPRESGKDRNAGQKFGGMGGGERSQPGPRLKGFAKGGSIDEGTRYAQEVANNPKGYAGKSPMTGMKKGGPMKKFAVGGAIPMSSETASFTDRPIKHAPGSRGR